MSIVITRLSDGATTSPDRLAMPYDVTDESRNVETDLISGDMAVALTPPRPGRGTFTLVYGTEAAARAARALHRGRSAFTMVDSGNASRNSTYVLGTGGQSLTRDGAGAWVLSISYREVDL